MVRPACRLSLYLGYTLLMYTHRGKSYIKNVFFFSSHGHFEGFHPWLWWQDGCSTSNVLVPQKALNKQKPVMLWFHCPLVRQGTLLLSDVCWEIWHTTEGWKLILSSVMKLCFSRVGLKSCSILALAQQMSGKCGKVVCVCAFTPVVGATWGSRLVTHAAQGQWKYSPMSFSVLRCLWFMFVSPPVCKADFHGRSLLKAPFSQHLSKYTLGRSGSSLIPNVSL